MVGAAKGPGAKIAGALKGPGSKIAGAIKALVEKLRQNKLSAYAETVRGSSGKVTYRVRIGANAREGEQFALPA